jgi:hypothetical protein
MNRLRFLFAAFLFSLILISLATPGSNTQANISVPQVVRSARAAVYKLRIQGKSFCTGFAVDTGKQKVLVSAGHCAQAAALGLPIAAYNSDTGKSSLLKLIRAEDRWPHRDHSVWNFLGGDPAYGLTLTDQTPRVGDEVYGIVAPSRMAPFLVVGLYSGTATNADDPTDEINGMHLITAHGVIHGASGSPLLDSRGRVWGILVGGGSVVPGAALVLSVPQM